ncbi:hypothetical protein ACFL27_07800 [candidate division CSSED10-310 bacterium]|uniref:Uncharacterized protein n=1 Tax=candidate division CSSED10-310 bacterium TaxID=2855610 RepID=A0ABV6YV80_UNCC1
MFSRNYRNDNNIVVIVSQALFVFCLWFVVVGIARFPRITSIYDFY